MDDHKNHVCPACYGDTLSERATIRINSEVVSWDSEGSPLSYGETEHSWEDYKRLTPGLVCYECGFECEKPVVMTDDELDKALIAKPVEEMIEPKVIQLDTFESIFGGE